MKQNTSSFILSNTNTNTNTSSQHSHTMQTALLTPTHEDEQRSSFPLHRIIDGIPPHIKLIWGTFGGITSILLLLACCLFSRYLVEQNAALLYTFIVMLLGLNILIHALIGSTSCISMHFTTNVAYRAFIGIELITTFWIQIVLWISYVFGIAICELFQIDRRDDDVAALYVGVATSYACFVICSIIKFCAHMCKNKGSQLNINADENV